jgi:N6-L-threonylcarbamoyladenine synthase
LWGGNRAYGIGGGQPRDAAAQGIKVWLPPFSLSTDNAAMIARRGFELYKKGILSKLNMAGNPSLQIH